MPTIVGSRSGAKPMCKRFADDLVLFAREPFQVVEPEGVSAPLEAAVFRQEGRGDRPLQVEAETFSSPLHSLLKCLTTKRAKWPNELLSRSCAEPQTADV